MISSILLIINYFSRQDTEYSSNNVYFWDEGYISTSDNYIDLNSQDGIFLIYHVVWRTHSWPFHDEPNDKGEHCYSSYKLEGFNDESCENSRNFVCVLYGFSTQITIHRF